MSVISTYLNDNAQTPLNRSVVYMLYKQICNKHADKTNRWSLGLSIGCLKRRMCDNQRLSCAHLLIAARWVARRIVCKSTVAQTKMDQCGHNHAPFRGHLSSLWEDLIWSPFVKNWELYKGHYEDMKSDKKYKNWGGLGHFDTIPERDRQTHRHTHTHTDTRRRHIPRLA